MSKKNVLVFPCGSEVGLEIASAVGTSAHFALVGATSIDDAGSAFYPELIKGLPYVHEAGFRSAIRRIVAAHHIDVIYPAMDSVILALAECRGELGASLAAPSLETVATCNSKRLTYERLGAHIRVPRVYEAPGAVAEFPVFVKPHVGYGSRQADIVNGREELAARIKNHPELMMLEFLPGEEYTVDCFSKPGAGLVFCAPRARKKTAGGISVNIPRFTEDAEPFWKMGRLISDQLAMRGGWFFQVRRSRAGELTLLEAACRIAGSSAYARVRGVNLPLLTLYEFTDCPYEVPEPAHPDLHVYRSLSSRAIMALNYERVYLDLDDCLILDGKVNDVAIAFVYRQLARGIQVILLTRHDQDLAATLARHRLAGVFDQVIKIASRAEPKSAHIMAPAIFIDDSYRERKEVARNARVPVFAPDVLGLLP